MGKKIIIGKVIVGIISIIAYMLTLCNTDRVSSFIRNDKKLLEKIEKIEWTNESEIQKMGDKYMEYGFVFEQKSSNDENRLIFYLYDKEPESDAEEDVTIIYIDKLDSPYRSRYYMVLANGTNIGYELYLQSYSQILFCKLFRPQKLIEKTYIVNFDNIKIYVDDTSAVREQRFRTFVMKCS